MPLQEKLQKIAASYDKKIASGINKKLAAEDDYFFNHSGIFLSEKTADEAKHKTFNEKEYLNLLHQLEKNLVLFATPYVGRPSPNKCLFDAGSGGGGSAIMIHQKLGYKITGYTLSKRQAAFGNVAAQKYNVGNNVHFTQGDMLRTVEGDNAYDVIWACESTEHVSEKNLRKMFNEFARISKPGASLILIAWTNGAKENNKQKKIKKLIDEHYITDIHSAKEYIAKGEKEGWKLLDLIDLKSKTLPYWEVRSKSKNATGAEKFFIEGYTEGVLDYFLYVFKKR